MSASPGSCGWPGCGRTADFDYTTGSETDFQTEVSFDGGQDWGSGSGSTSVTMTHSFTQTLNTIGPNDARRALLYTKFDVTTKTYPAGCAGKGSKAVKHIKITADSIALPTGTNNPLKWGTKNFLGPHNTVSDYNAISSAHPRYPIYEKPGYKATLNWGNGTSYTEGAEVLGVGISTTSSLSSDTSQHWYASDSSRYSRHIWSNRGNMFKITNPEVFYSDGATR